jgi:hypothetical protein
MAKSPAHRFGQIIGDLLEEIGCNPPPAQVPSQVIRHPG